MKYIIILLSTFICITTQTKNAITFALSGGRLGDNILAYCKHKLIAYQQNLDLYIPSFPYQEYFAFHTHEKKQSRLPDYYAHQININNDDQIKAFNADHTLFHSNYYATLNGISDLNLWIDYIFKKSIEDEQFGHILEAALSLNYTAKDTIFLPQDKTTVALHIRKGGDGYDYPLLSQQYETEHDDPIIQQIYCDVHHALKFPPEQFYAESLQKLYDYLGKKQLYVYIFTNDRAPHKIMKRLQNFIKNSDITFACRNGANAHNINIIEDIYTMSKFEYMIRSESHFPWIAQMIGNHKGIIHPLEMTWIKNYLKVTKASLVLPDRTIHALKTIDFNYCCQDTFQ